MFAEEVLANHSQSQPMLLGPQLCVIHLLHVIETYVGLYALCQGYMNVIEDDSYLF